MTIRSIKIPRPVLIACDALYAAATLLISALWMINARVQQGLSSVELGFESYFIP